MAVKIKKGYKIFEWDGLGCWMVHRNGGRQLVGTVVSLNLFDPSYGWWAIVKTHTYGPFKQKIDAQEVVEAFACRAFLMNEVDKRMKEEKTKA